MELSLLTDIVTAEYNISKVQNYIYNYDYLSDYKIITKSQTKTNVSDLLDVKVFCGDKSYGIYNIFLENKLLFIDKHIYNKNYVTGSTVNFDIDYSISLDTQAVSFLENLSNNKNISIPEFNKSIDYIFDNNMSFDIMPYLLENTYKFDDENIYKGVVQTLSNLQIFLTADREHYKKTKELRSSLSEIEQKNNIDKQISLLKDLHGSINITGYRLYDYPLYLLISMVRINLESNKSPNYKFSKFMELCIKNNNMALRFIIIAHEYFNNKNLKFFRKIQRGKNRHDLLKELENMAWDLHHLTQLENPTKFYDGENERNFFLNLFLTFDQGLIDLISLCPLEALVYSVKNKTVLPIYAEGSLPALSKYHDEFSVSKTKARIDALSKQADDLPDKLERAKEMFLA